MDTSNQTDTGALHNKTTVIFDFDGTLGDTLPVILEVINKLGPDYGIKAMDQAEFDALRSLSHWQLMAKYHFLLLKLPVLITRSQEEMHANMERVKLHEGMAEVLEALSRKGVRLGILSSNSPKNLDAFLKNNNLTMFRFVHSERNLFGKDTALRNMAKEQGIDLAGAVYVGDETRDIAACKKCNLDIISVTWGFNTRQSLTDAKPTRIADSPRDILTYVAV